MKKTSFVIAILASALLAGACGGNKNKAPASPPAGETGTAPPPANAGSGGDMGSATGSGSGSGGW